MNVLISFTDVSQCLFTIKKLTIDWNAERSIVTWARFTEPGGADVWFDRYRADYATVLHTAKKLN